VTPSSARVAPEEHRRAPALEALQAELGRHLLHGTDVSKARGRRALIRYRSQVQMIFQDRSAR